MFSNTKDFKENFERRLLEKYGNSIEDSHITEKYDILGEMVRDYASYNWRSTQNEVRNDNKKRLVGNRNEKIFGL